MERGIFIGSRYFAIHGPNHNGKGEGTISHIHVRDTAKLPIAKRIIFLWKHRGSPRLPEKAPVLPAPVSVSQPAFQQAPKA